MRLSGSTATIQFAATRFHNTLLAVGRRSLPVSYIPLVPGPSYLASTAPSFPVSAGPSSCTGINWEVRVVHAGSISMDQQPASGTHSRATGSGKNHDKAPDDVVDVLARSIQLGAAAGTVFNA